MGLGAAGAIGFGASGAAGLGAAPIGGGAAGLGAAGLGAVVLGAAGLGAAGFAATGLGAAGLDATGLDAGALTGAATSFFAGAFFAATFFAGAFFAAAFLAGRLAAFFAGARLAAAFLVTFLVAFFATFLAVFFAVFFADFAFEAAFTAANFFAFFSFFAFFAFFAMIVLPIVAADLPIHTGIIKTRLAAVWNSKSTDSRLPNHIGRPLLSSALGAGPPVAQSINSIGCTTGIPMPAAIWVMQPIFPAAIKSGAISWICAILRSRNRFANSGCKTLYVPADPQQIWPSGMSVTEYPALDSISFGSVVIFWPCCNEQAAW
jgi:hypothetical protein